MQKLPLAARCDNPGQNQLTSRKTALRCLSEEFFTLFRIFRDQKFPGRKEDSVRVPKRAAGHLGRSSSQISDSVSTQKHAGPSS